MIKQLRRKFILIAMLSVVVVIGAIIGIINAVNYAGMVSDADDLIELLLQNGGVFPQEGALGKGGQDKITVETPYETRYVTVYVNENGEASVRIMRLAAINEDTACSYAEELSARGRTKGFYGVYRYRAAKDGGGTLYVFLDCSSDIATFRTFLLSSVLISAGGVLLVLILVVVLSRFALRPVEESYLKQRSFITNASHDIKTPLTIISADAEVLELDYGETEWSGDIKKQVARLTSLTDKLVFLSRMEEERKTETKPFDFSAAAEEVCGSYDSIARVRGIDYRTEIAPNIMYDGNEEMLRQAIALILDNAVKYAKSRIDATLKRTGKLELRVRNDADGLKAGSCNEFFDRFYRADLSRNSRTGGHGIGLSVVRSIVLAHKGKISAQSPDGVFVEFTVLL